MNFAGWTAASAFQSLAHAAWALPIRTEVLSVTMHLRRRDRAALDEEIERIVSSSNPRFLSHEEFAARFGTDPADLDLVFDFARSRGLSVVDSDAVSGTVEVRGTVARMNAAFAVDLGRYESPTKNYRGREGYVYIPVELSGVVEAVLGLDDRRIARHIGK